MSVAIRAITRIQDADDAPTLGAGQNGQALTWDNATSAFVATTLFTGGLLATGATTGATSQAQTFTNGIIGPSWKPSANSTTALQLQNAAGTAVVTLDTTNGYVGVSGTPSYRLHIQNPAGSSFGLVVDGAGAGRSQLRLRDDDTTYRFDGQMSSSGMAFTSYKDAPSAGYQNITFTGAIVTLDAVTYNKFAISTTEQGRWTNAGLVVAGKAYNPASRLHVQEEDAVTNAVTNVFTVGHNTSGTAANGFGSGVLYQLESSTTADQSAARIQALWYEATHATRKADLVLTAYDTSEREGLRVRGNGSAPAIGFLGATPIARKAHVADPAGGATVDAEARAAINAILVSLEDFGFHATS